MDTDRVLDVLDILAAAWPAFMVHLPCPEFAS